MYTKKAVFSVLSLLNNERNGRLFSLNYTKAHVNLVPPMSLLSLMSLEITKSPHLRIFDFILRLFVDPSISLVHFRW